MADISVTAANVKKGSGATTITGTAGETITAGQVLYLDTADNEYKKADADASASAVAAGIALCGAADGQPIIIQTGGNINIGGTVTVGEIYVVSATAGGVAPEGDLTTGNYVTVLGIGTTTANIALKIHSSGAVA